MKKLKSGNEQEKQAPLPEIIKVPGQITGFSYKKMQNEWDITFTVQPEHLEHAQPLQDEMKSYFVLCFIKVTDKGQAEGLLRKNLEDIDINP